MATVSDSIRIDAPKDQVWAVLADFGGILNYNPGISNAYSTSDVNSGLGATRHCDLLPMGSIEERIIEWNEGSDYLVDIYQFNGLMPPIKSAQARLSVEADGDQSIAHMIMTFEMKMGVIGKAMSTVMLESQYQKAVTGIMQGLKLYVETGQQGTRDNIKLAFASA
ncbi:MAG: SRPBCC family protein [Chloroflexota bacterium]